MRQNELKHYGIKGMKWGVRQKEILLRDEATNRAKAEGQTAASKRYGAKAKSIEKNKTRADGTIGRFTKMRVKYNNYLSRNTANKSAEYALRASVAGKLARGKKLNGDELVMKKKIFDEEMMKVSSAATSATMSGIRAYDAHQKNKSGETDDSYAVVVNAFASASSAATAATAAERAAAYS